MEREAMNRPRYSNNIHVGKTGGGAMVPPSKGRYELATADLIPSTENAAQNGREVLEEIKNDPLLKHIPITVLTMSQDEEDVLKAYRLYANCYIAKPVDFDSFVEVVKSIKHFWFSVVALPNSK